MTVSIIIAVKTWQKNLEECVDNCLKLDYRDFEIIVLPDEYKDSPLNQKISLKEGRVPFFVIPTGPVSPAHKRDIALDYAQGEILAFIDDDAYPRADWLKNSIINFQDSEVAAVGGPAITPPNDNFRQKASGLVYSNFLISGNFIYRYLPAAKRMVDDYPSCNFLVRKSIMQELGGFDTVFWPGEDTKLCLDITKKLKKKIVYDPEVLVWHHRRMLFKGHLRQICAYALHRGYFVKKYPQTSLKISYFIPSLFLSGLFLGAILSFYSPLVKIAYYNSLFLYLFLAFIFSISKELHLIPFVFFGIIITHLSYGYYFIKGLISWRLKEEF